MNWLKKRLRRWLNVEEQLSEAQALHLVEYVKGLSDLVVESSKLGHMTSEAGVATTQALADLRKRIDDIDRKLQRGEYPPGTGRPAYAAKPGCRGGCGSSGCNR